MSERQSDLQPWALVLDGPCWALGPMLFSCLQHEGRVLRTLLQLDSGPGALEWPFHSPSVDYAGQECPGWGCRGPSCGRLVLAPAPPRLCWGAVAPTGLLFLEGLGKPHPGPRGWLTCISHSRPFYLGCLPLPLRISFSLCPKKLEGRSWLPSPGPAASPATDHCAAFAAWWLVRLPFGVTQGSARASFCCWYPNFPSDCRRTDLRVGLATVRSASSLLLPLECEFVGRGYCWPFETLREAWPLLATEGGLDAIALA